WTATNTSEPRRNHLTDIPFNKLCIQTMSFPSNVRIIDPECLGNSEFKAEYGVKYAYTAGAMYKAIASEALVVAMARTGLIGYFGTGGLTLSRINAAIESIKSQVNENQSFGMNL